MVWFYIERTLSKTRVFLVFFLNQTLMTCETLNTKIASKFKNSTLLLSRKKNFFFHLFFKKKVTREGDIIAKGCRWPLRYSAKFVLFLITLIYFIYTSCERDNQNNGKFLCGFSAIQYESASLIIRIKECFSKIRQYYIKQFRLSQQMVGVVTYTH